MFKYEVSEKIRYYLFDDSPYQSKKSINGGYIKRNEWLKKIGVTDYSDGCRILMGMERFGHIMSKKRLDKVIVNGYYIPVEYFTETEV